MKAWSGRVHSDYSRLQREHVHKKTCWCKSPLSVKQLNHVQTDCSSCLYKSNHAFENMLTACQLVIMRFFSYAAAKSWLFSSMKNLDLDNLYLLLWPSKHSTHSLSLGSCLPDPVPQHMESQLKVLPQQLAGCCPVLQDTSQVQQLLELSTGEFH